jgi:hypothetical protein
VGGFAAETLIIAAAITSGHGKVSERTMFQLYSDRTALFTGQYTPYFLWTVSLTSLAEREGAM